METMRTQDNGRELDDEDDDYRLFNGVLYSLGETYEYSEDFCENYTCVYWFGYQFVQNWEVYPRLSTN